MAKAQCRFMGRTVCCTYSRSPNLTAYSSRDVANSIIAYFRAAVFITAALNILQLNAIK